MKPTSENIAKICHEANKAYCESLGDKSQKHWSEADEWQKESALRGVLFRLQNPNAGDSAQHDNWMKDKIEDGWVYGPIKDVVAKTHPCILPFNKLPINQQLKDKLFTNICKALI